MNGDHKFTNWETDVVYQWAGNKIWRETDSKKLAYEIGHEVMNMEPPKGGFDGLNLPEPFFDLLEHALNNVDYNQIANALLDPDNILLP